MFNKSTKERKNMITIKKIEGNLKPFFTLIDDATNKTVGLVKGKNWLIKKQGWQLCKNQNFLTNHKNTGHYNKISKCWFFDNATENFMEDANKRLEIQATLDHYKRLNQTI